MRGEEERGRWKENRCSLHLLLAATDGQESLLRNEKGCLTVVIGTPQTAAIDLKWLPSRLVCRICDKEMGPLLFCSAFVV